MKLILAIVNNDDSAYASASLTEEGFFVTKLSTTGGFLMVGNTTFLIGTQDEDAQKRIDLIIALENSHSFAKTHSLISQLQHCKTWTDNDMENLFEIAMNNSQVRYILTDPDVRAFYETLLEGQQQLSVDGQAVQAILAEG